MKKILLTLAVSAGIFASAFAQVPEKINYQGVARNPAGNILPAQTIGLKFTIHSSSVNGPNVYSETHSTTTNEFGLFNIQIGGGTVVSGTFSSIDWGNDSFYLQVEMDAAGGTTYLDMGTSQLVSVPYALYAKTSGATDAIDGTPGQVAIFDSTGHAVVNSNSLYNDVSRSNFGMGTTTPNPNAILQISSTTKGVLLPRMNTTQINFIPVSNADKGLLVYNFDTNSFWYWNGTAWVEM